MQAMEMENFANVEIPCGIVNSNPMSNGVSTLKQDERASAQDARESSIFNEHNAVSSSKISKLTPFSQPGSRPDNPAPRDSQSGEYTMHELASTPKEPVSSQYTVPESSNKQISAND